MQLTLTQSQIRGLLDGLPAGHPERPALEALVREQSTLRVLHEIGLAAEADQATRDRFAKWPESNIIVYPSREDAEAAVPRAFKSVCTEWGRAGYVYGVYPLADGRKVVRHGIWWDAPEPGGRCVAFYFA
jgi:hypothetical protein